MAADRREAVNLVLNQIFQDEPGITAAETLLEFARRSADGRNLRIKRQEAVDLLRGKWRYATKSTSGYHENGRAPSASTPR